MTFTDLVARSIQALEAKETVDWGLADLWARELPETRGAAKALASELGCSAAYISSRIRAAKAFTPEQRATIQGMPFSVFVECARTSDPMLWAEKATDQRWSLRELKEALASAGERKVSARERKACERCEELVEHLRYVHGTLLPVASLNESSGNHLREYVEKAIEGGSG